jgi:hypothetical protein
VFLFNIAEFLFIFILADHKSAFRTKLFQYIKMCRIVRKRPFPPKKNSIRIREKIFAKIRIFFQKPIDKQEGEGYNGSVPQGNNQKAPS